MISTAGLASPYHQKILDKLGRGVPGVWHSVPVSFQTSCWLVLVKTSYFPVGEETLMPKGY